MPKEDSAHNLFKLMFQAGVFEFTPKVLANFSPGLELATTLGDQVMKNRKR